MHTQTSSSSRWWLLILCVFAAIGGLCCVVLPPYIIPGGIKQPYSGWTIVPWFQTAINNVAFIPTWSLLFALGFLLGVMQPRFWWLLGPLTLLLLPVLLGIDLVRFPTSHNLWPFDCLFYIYVAWTAVPGAFVGFLLRYVLRKKRAAGQFCKTLNFQAAMFAMMRSRSLMRRVLIGLTCNCPSLLGETAVPLPSEPPPL